MKKLNKKQGGFTLIEVVLVLAIGALIILMALLAFGGASRSRRDTARTDLAGQIQAAVEQSASNSNGAYPDDAEFGRLKSANAWKDPSSGTGGVTFSASTVTPTSASVTYMLGGVCSADGKTVASVDTTNTSKYAIVYFQESSKVTVCKSN